MYFQGQPSILLRRSSRGKSSLTQNITTETSSTFEPTTNYKVFHRTVSGKSTSSSSSAVPTSNSQLQAAVGGGGVERFSAAGPSTSSTVSTRPTQQTSSTMSSENVRKAIDEQGTSSGAANSSPFIKLNKLSMPLLDTNQRGMTSNSSRGAAPSTVATGASGGVDTGTASGGLSQQPDSESDDSEVGRLQALLEARGLPPQLFGALGPRMHHLLHRTIGVTSTSKAQTLLQGLQSTDESQQLQAAIEMCQMLVMGNEDTLAGFPIKQVVPALIVLLRMEHNFDLMMNACRALAYMLEALPRSSATVVDAIPAFLEKLQVIQWVDVAEQSLTALEILSRRHNKCILQANGVSTCLTYLDFFSINAQRSALAITANCCQNIHSEEFYHIKDSIPLLARLIEQQDKKSVDSICTAFHRLVDSFQHDSVFLQDIASVELLKNCQQLLVVTPPILSSGTFTNVVRMLSIMCANCPDLALRLLKNDIAATLLYLLTGSTELVSGEVELVPRNPAELYEITCLIGELMPRLPTDGIFTVDALLERSQSGQQDAVQWQWKDDRGVWRAYSSIDSRMIEAAHQNSDDEISLTALGRTYTIDFNSMQQVNEDSGTTRPVQRKVTANFAGIGSEESNQASVEVNILNYSSTLGHDARITSLTEEHGLGAHFIKTLFSVLYEVYSSSAGPAVRYKCLRALLRMVYFANSELLQEVLKNQLVSAHIAGMMASNDVRIVVGALQMAEILMQKLPNVFSVHFRREGVMHQINLLADESYSLCAISAPPKSCTNKATTILKSPSTSSSPNDFSQVTPSTSKEPTAAKSFEQNAHSSKFSVPIPSTSNSLILNAQCSNPNSVPVAATTFSTVAPDSLPSLNSFSPATAAASLLSSSVPPGTTVQKSQHSNIRISEILKKKIPPKRKSQNRGRSKSRSEEAAAYFPQTSLVQDLPNKSLPPTSSSGQNTPSTSSTTSKSRFTNATSKTTSFLQSLNPVRWRRMGSQSSSSTFYKDNPSNLSKTVSSSNLLVAGNREKAKKWIRDHSISFVRRYANDDTKGAFPVFSILDRLKSILQQLNGDFDECFYALNELKAILIESDISPFEVNHSGLIKALIGLMTNECGLTDRPTRLRMFLHVFVGLPLSSVSNGPVKIIETSSFSCLVAKLNGCISQLEQFPVKVHDFPAGFGGRSNTSALKFFNTHQLKVSQFVDQKSFLLT